MGIDDICSIVGDLWLEYGGERGDIVCVSVAPPDIPFGGTIMGIYGRGGDA